MTGFNADMSVEHEGETLRLVLDMNAVCAFDEATGLNFFEVAEAFEMQSKVPQASVLRAIVHAALQHHHADKTVEDAGRLLSADLELFGQLIAKAVKGAAPAQPARGKRKPAAA